MDSKKTLRNIFRDSGSLKIVHNYSKVYTPLLEGLRLLPVRLLEVGVLEGFSLIAWAEFFPEGEITGLDTFERVSLPNVKKRVGDSFRLVQGDSSKPSPLLEGSEFDIIIDDGDHSFESQLATLETLWPLLRRGEGSRYFIEDINLAKSAQPAYEQLLLGVKSLDGDFIRHDLTSQTGRPDSCIISLRKD